MSGAQRWLKRESELEWPASLAAAIFRQTIVDLAGGLTSPAYRQAAHFVNSRWFAFWADVAGISPERLRAWVRHRTHGHDT